MDQKELLNRISKGDEVAFGYLYETYRPAVYRFLISYVHSLELAEDLCQELFLKIWGNRQEMRHIRDFRPYLNVMARNLAINSLKKITVSEMAMKELLAHYPCQQETTENDVRNNEYRAMLEKELSRLPKRSRAVFALCREEGKSYDEAAKALGISRNAIKNHMVSTLKVLKAFAEKQLGVSIFLLLFGILGSLPGI